ncbi:MAG: GNAT family N-acetyltransferase [Gammaproteobacteria bacterium]|nr:GNAT family N-acetyltransferase [Gammaproteobacteria bacterium]
MIRIRDATESDVEQIRDVFLAIYGEDYSHPQFYDIPLLKKMVYSDDIILLVAEDLENGSILGTASVLLSMGGQSDLLGVFGRLVVHPEARKRGVGKLLMEHRLERLSGRLHLALVEPRAVHIYAQKIALNHGFAPIGFQPMKLLLSDRESLTIFVHYFGDSLKLRRNHPKIIAEVYPLAEMAQRNCGLSCDAIVEEQPGVYPHDGRFELEELTTEDYSALLHFQRGRVHQREIFGPIRLHYGLHWITSRQSNYLIAREHGHLVGGIGFSLDLVEKTARIFELISLTPSPVRFLLSELIRLSISLWGIEYLEVDVSAYAPSMQRTLLELGFLPVAYIPAMVFHEVERLDGIRMARITMKPDRRNMEIIPECEQLSRLVLRGFIDRQVIPRVAEAIPQIALFNGMNDEQVRLVAGRCTLLTFQNGDVIVQEGQVGQHTYIVLTGEASVTTSSSDGVVGSVLPGECLGEMSLLTRTGHSATALARSRVEAAALPYDEIMGLIRLRPDIGVIIYRNLATGLGRKLIRSGRKAASVQGEEPGDRSSASDQMH